ncbi:LEAF RUST 10 DISEASE-RESISTANCE LOCUS RECEPTOR-LIKE PROTEIN KINASE-like 2.5 [Dichanthelium oligosanthes]|uniref:LEAF RUST 10 DISEASE-RESISTANCE LOCUS RECEPTOR-LIKE PROTEIN KINASE-like 2.5 n=1 Tax=Dichanthelium oligosanthes TaxID=888268 RepID=A0A1E5VN63_9POAL|nr:LEAF RUST 10 DISEASE-RESISTANCE LOCUS RECEPTOR-LIKE PROTEIN KINASE-like 2.5 [Dichanthelium oligosanthes]
MRELASSSSSATSSSALAAAAALRGWWDDVNESPQWQDAAFFSLAAAYALVSAVALIQLIRIQRRVPELGWTTQKIFHLMNFLVNGGNAFNFLYFSIRLEMVYKLVLLDLPGLLFFSTYTLLVLFWAEIYHQVCIWIYLGINDNAAVELASKIFIVAVSFIALLGFSVYGGRLFFLLRRFPIESKGRQKKLYEVGTVTAICVTCFLIRCVVVALSAFDPDVSLEVLDHPILDLFYYTVTEILPSALVLFVLRKLPPKRGSSSPVSLLSVPFGTARMLLPGQGSAMDAAALLCSSRRRLLAVSVVLVSLLPGVLPQAAPNLCATKANGRYACPDCSTSNLAHGAAFEANLLRLRDTLRDMAAANSSFLNATFGAEEDTVYGLATCLADAEMSDCAACLEGAAAELPGTRCAGRRDMILWYPRCLVRYGNASFFGVADTSPDRRFDVPNPNNFSDPVALDKARTRLEARMVAAAAGSPLRFAFDDESVNANTTLHGLAQCTEDLSLQECTRCLANHMVWLGVCCADMDGVRLNGPSCYVRYEFMAFAPGTTPSMAPFLEPPSASAPSPSATPSSRKKTRTYVLAGALVCVLVGAACCGILWYKKKRSSAGSSRKRMESLLRQHQQYPRRYSYAQVKRMTGSFGHKLGQGGNGAVYKGSLLDGGGRAVAVKMLKEAKVDGEEFINEVASISRTSHVNVVTLLGFCLEGSGSKCKRGLIYEYMPNGSLERYTAGDGGNLSWEQMLDIAVGIARGLEYLHRGCNAHIVHFDIKPHNILLDAAFRPKISDFGLAKLCPQKESTISVSIAGARGTVGYIAPEVFSRQVGAVTSKSDVYSYGMMVLEMVGARRSIVNGGGDTADSGTGASSSYFPQCLYQDLDGFCASAACGPEEETDAAEVVRKMVIAGLWCIRMSPADRPSMSRVVEMLENTTTAELQLPPESS